MNVMGYYGLDGQPISDEEWADLRDSRRRVVGRTVVSFDPYTWVSTALLGLDHGFGDGPPLIFETMIFGGEHNLWEDRYSTLDAAERGHLRVVKALLAGIDPNEEEL